LVAGENTMSGKKLTDKEKDTLDEALKGAVLSDSELERLAEGVDESGETVMPVEGGEDLISAAALALDFVDHLETSAPREITGDEDAVAGFDALLKKLETLRADISSLQRGVVGVFAAQLLTFRGNVVDLKSRISEEMVERLRMKFYKQFIESMFVDIVDSEFSALEKDLVDKIVEQTQERFKEFALRVRESEVDLRRTIVEQQDIVRSFMTSLEEETAAQRTELAEKQSEIAKLEVEIRNLQSKVDTGMVMGVAKEEYERRISSLEEEVKDFKDDILLKDALIEKRTQNTEEARKEVEELTHKLSEAKSQIEVYKEKAALAKPQSEKTEAEIEALNSKIELLETKLEETRTAGDATTATIKQLETQIEDLKGEKAGAEREAAERLAEIENMQSRFAEVKVMDEKIHTLEREIKDAKEQMNVVEMQKDAFEKATRLMEKERDIALQQRDLSDERTQRYIKVLGMEGNTKVLLLVDEVGSISFTELGKSLGVPKGQAMKWARELDKLGVLTIKGETVKSTLKEIDIKEGQVKVEKKQEKSS
jgi:septal ring factor EnvC (AmiA/AmiB activator)